MAEGSVVLQLADRVLRSALPLESELPVATSSLQFRPPSTRDKRIKTLLAMRSFIPAAGANMQAPSGAKRRSKETMQKSACYMPSQIMGIYSYNGA